MQTQILQRIGLAGLTVVIAASVHQPLMQARMQARMQSNIQLSGPTAPSAPSLAPQLAMASGSPFVGSAHSTSGSAQIVSIEGQRYLEFDSAFRTDNGPDLFVLLHSEAVPSSYSPEDYVNLGQLQQIAGTQRYAIPAGTDISAFQSAVIWCRAFDVTFGYATL